MIYFDKICELLPHEYPFIFVDAVEEFDKQKHIRAIKNVTGNEWMFTGHFPKRALYPGVLIIEGLAQAAIILLKLQGDDKNDAHNIYMIAGVKARFLKPVVPGDQMIYECTIDKVISTGGIIKSKALVKNELVAKADITFAIQKREENL